jgi:cytochrome c oxidase subunit 2
MLDSGYPYLPDIAATPMLMGMVEFHNFLMFFLIIIGTMVLYLLLYTSLVFRDRMHPQAQNFTHSSELEIGWTIFPAIILLIIAIPSFSLLYSLDDLVDPAVTIKIIGHQWYWSYEYSDYSKFPQSGYTIAFDSYIVATGGKDKDFFENIEHIKGRIGWAGIGHKFRVWPEIQRLLTVDNAMYLPLSTHVKILVTSSDVIHSWAVPSFGIKIDATPGRLTQGSLFVKRMGTFWGQCSEICGVNHAFMPINVSVNPIDVYRYQVSAWLYWDDFASRRFKIIT